MRLRWAMTALGSAALAIGVMSSACGSGQTKDNPAAQSSGPGVTVTAPNASPISNATPVGSRTAAAGSSGSASQEQGKPEAIVATDNKWDRATITIQSGTAYTITMQNKGAALHNFHITGVKGADGKDITSAIVGGGQNAPVTFTISQKGTFDFVCDVHPTEMKGKITVQ